MKKNELAVLEIFRKDIFLEKTIREISITLKKSYPKVHEAIKLLEKKKILTLKQHGNSLVTTLNLTPESINELSHYELNYAFSRGIKNIEKILSFEMLYDDIILVTGSYAKKTEIKTSDIDLVIITEDSKKQKLIENLTLTFKPEFHIITFNKKDFIAMLLSNQENFGKEVFRNRLIFRNAERFYLLIKEAVKNGFNSKIISGKS